MKDRTVMMPPTRALRGLLAVALLAAPARAGEVASDLAEYMDAAVRVKQFQGSVLVAREGEALLRAGYGPANAEHDVPNGPETKFRLGSVTKQFTAMAIMILTEQGKLKPDDPIGEHLDDAPEAWKDVTIHHLLTHTSGIPSYTGMPDYRAKMAEPTTVKGMIARFRDKPLEFEPGSKHEYSNSGYFLLGAIIEEVSGESYEDFLDEAIFEPLGMADTGYDRPEKVLKHRASGYRRLGKALLHDAYLDMGQPYAAGSLYSTVDDLLKWDRALAAGKLISAESYERMFTPDKDDYAYGWSVSKVKGRQHVEHGGGINGFLTYFLRVPDEGVCVAVLCNVSPADPKRVAYDLAAIALGDEVERPEAPKFVAVDPALFDDYAGRYRLGAEMVLNIAREGDALMGSPTGQPKLELKPLSEAEYLVEPVDARIRFVRDDAGKVTHLVLKQRGRETRGERLEDGGDGAERKDKD